MFELLFLGFAALAGKAVGYLEGDGEDGQSGYQPAAGYPPVQYAAQNSAPAQYGYPQQQGAYRVQERYDQDCAYAYADPRTGAFHVDVTLPSVTKGAFDTRMQYDSGASCVVLSHADFRAMGLDLRRQRFDIKCDTASGVIRAAPVMLPMMGVGQIRLNEVRALVTQQDCGVSLLGQTALQQFSQIIQRGPEIILQR